jgi:hypothetical protein
MNAGYVKEQSINAGFVKEQLKATMDSQVLVQNINHFSKKFFVKMTIRVILCTEFKNRIFKMRKICLES